MEFGAGIFEVTDSRYQQLSKLVENTMGNASKGPVSLGLPQWGVREWRECFYPHNLSPTEYLKFYSQHLKCVELSSTFYSRVSDERIEQWVQQVGEGFKFLPKWPKLITHTNSLKHIQAQTSDFLRQLELFDDKLGTSILQLPPNFSRDFNRELYYFLLQIPKGVPMAIELRHSSWFDSGMLYPKLFDYLSKQNFGVVVSDLPSRGDLFHTSFTEGMSVVRFLSDEVSVHDELRLKHWKDYLKSHEGEIAFCLHRPSNQGTPNMLSHLDQDVWQRISSSRLKQEENNLKLFE